jgi:DNA invertase Pin-like site-specific DNA recombinase
LKELLAYARRGDTLAVVRLDRLGRSVAELLTTVTMLKERGIALLSLEERIDTSSAAWKLIFPVFIAIAHFERRLIAERTKDGIAAARARGKAARKATPRRGTCRCCSKARRRGSFANRCRESARPRKIDRVS